MKTLFLKQSFLFTALLLSAAFITNCCIVDPDSAHNQNHEAIEPFQYNIELGNLDRVRITGINGSIEIIGDSSVTMAEIWGEKTVRSDSRSDAIDHLDDLQVEIDSDQNILCIETVQPKDTHGRSYEVDYHLLIPPSWKTYALNVNGNIYIEAMHNDVTSGLTNGDITLMDVEGNINADVVNGEITGAVTIPLAGVCFMNIVNGQIDIDIPKETSAEFLASVTNGSIQITDLVINNLQSTPKTMQGILGDGEGTMQLSIVNGPIYVRGF